VRIRHERSQPLIIELHTWWREQRAPSTVRRQSDRLYSSAGRRSAAHASAERTQSTRHGGGTVCGQLSAVMCRKNGFRFRLARVVSSTWYFIFCADLVEHLARAGSGHWPRLQGPACCPLASSSCTIAAVFASTVITSARWSFAGGALPSCCARSSWLGGSLAPPARPPHRDA
jgi:hypothetical protein